MDRPPGEGKRAWASRLAGGLDRTLEYGVIVLMAGLALLVVVGVGFRKAGASLVWYDELASIMLAWLTFYGAALAARKRAHIGFPRVVQGATAKRRRLLVLFREACVVGFFAAVAWAGWRVQGVLAGTTLVSMPSIPARLAHSVIPIGALLFIVAELSTLPEQLSGTLPAGYGEPPSGAGEPHEGSDEPPASGTRTADDLSMPRPPEDWP